MRDASARDPLELWRGIDDAIWREAARVGEPARPIAPVAVPAAAHVPPPCRSGGKRPGQQKPLLESV
jgi:hypothetical protein